ncbi:MAG: aldo/keto reductase [Anaerolineaceae bacterium]|jgi:aryl-alcohol dehydrogenase-like predicted oxidoreductase|nr:aldo/keto reductase [Anaerolineaceae bacterium]
MEKRRFGRTGHESTVAIFGACALRSAPQDEVDIAMQQVIDAGINHIDIAPSYGNAEAQISPWIPSIREDVFLGCKTMERTKAGAMKEMHESLKRLQTDHFDLYQIHAITNMNELDEATGTGSALEAMIDAREQGLIKYIGITGHGVESPTVFLEALRRFDFDSILFPVNFIQYGNPRYREAAQELIAECQRKDVGVMGIKYAARGPWGEQEKTHTMWYQPFTEKEIIQKSVDFALSQGVSGICTPCDITVMPVVVQACEHFTPMPANEQEALIASAASYTPLFT